MLPSGIPLHPGLKIAPVSVMVEVEVEVRAGVEVKMETSVPVAEIDSSVSAGQR